MRKGQQSQTIQNKVSAAIFTTSLVGLVVASIVFIVFDQTSIRQAMVQELSILAKVIADRTPAPLEFGDRDLATDTLSTLAARESIQLACIFDQSNEVFAEFRRDKSNSGNCHEHNQQEEVVFTPNYVQLIEPVVSSGDVIGTVLINSSLEELNRRLLRYLVTVALALIISVLVVTLLSQRISRVVGRPILELANRATDIGEGRYELVEPEENIVEISVLGKAFNQMLINLEDANKTLEDRLIELVNEINERELAEQKRAQLEEQLIQSQKMEAVGQLTGGIAHDFNNLLTIILGNLRLINDMLPEDADLQEVIEDALSAGNDAAKLTQSLLAFSRKQSLDPKVIELASQLENFVRILKPALTDRIELQLELSSSLPNIYVDGNQFESAILNLAINARDAMPQGGTIRITAKEIDLSSVEAQELGDLKPGRYVSVCVADTGHGMDSEVVERCTEPFFTTKSVGKGSGLGLSMVYGLVKQSHGGLKIESTEGLGTAVSLLFPVTNKVDEKADADVEEQNKQGVGTERILLVEDESRVRKLADRNLNQLGYQVVEASSGDEALQVLNEDSRFDLVFSDVLMPGEINGIQLAEKIKQRWPHIKVLLASGFNKDMSENPLPEHIFFLQKPYSKEQLAIQVRNALED